MACHSERSEKSVKVPPILKALLFFSCFFFISCSHLTVDKEAPAVNELKAGDKFRIILPENHDEGYLWKLSEYNKTLIDNMGAVWHGNSKGIYFRFITAQPGTDTLHFTLFKTDAVTKERDTVKTATYIIKVTE